LCHDGEGGAAITAVIVEILDHGDVGAWIADPGRPIGPRDGLPVLRDKLAILAVLEARHGLRDDLRMGEQVRAHLRTDRAAARMVHTPHRAGADHTPGEGGCRKQPAAHRRHFLFCSQIALAEVIAMSCARIQSEVLGGSEARAYRAETAAVRLSPTMLARSAVASAARAVSPGPLIDRAQLVPSKGVRVVARHGRAQHARSLAIVGRVLGRDQGVAIGGRDQRAVAGALGGGPERGERILRLAGFQQNLATHLLEIGVVGAGADER
jgi:hypothetical protein